MKRHVMLMNSKPLEMRANDNEVYAIETPHVILSYNIPQPREEYLSLMVDAHSILLNKYLAPEAQESKRIFQVIRNVEWKVNRAPNASRANKIRSRHNWLCSQAEYDNWLDYNFGMYNSASMLLAFFGSAINEFRHRFYSHRKGRENIGLLGLCMDAAADVRKFRKGTYDAGYNIGAVIEERFNNQTGSSGLTQARQNSYQKAQE